MSLGAYAIDVQSEREGVNISCSDSSLERLMRQDHPPVSALRQGRSPRQRPLLIEKGRKKYVV